MSATSSLADASHLPALHAGLARRAARLLPAGWIMLRQSVAPEEVVLATLGSVQVRETPAGVVARTAVKGEAEIALRNALQRLTRYTSGDNFAGRSLSTARPLVQRPDAPGRWSVQIGLTGMHSRFTAPVPRNGKVRILAEPSQTIATIRLSGRPQFAALVRGEAAVLAAIAGSGWIASGAATLRLYRAPGLLPWMGSFEVAVPVSAV